MLDIDQTPYDNLEFYIGCDSHVKSKYINYIVVLVMTMDGHGARGYYKNIRDYNLKISTKQRLFQETYYAVEFATFINPILESAEYSIKEIHTDLNPDPKFPSHAMIQTCIGYIKGFGFNGQVKPKSWASFEAADRFTK